MQRTSAADIRHGGHLATVDFDRVSRGCFSMSGTKDLGNSPRKMH